jgi:nitrite reductase/ring-hydroxylating ferredoxin subunit
MAEDREEQRAERFERYLDALLANGRPSPDDVADRDEAEMARLAAEVSAAANPAESAPDPAFVDQLRLRMRQADQGIASVQVPLPVRREANSGQATGPAAELSTHRGALRLTRRELLGAGLGAAAGLAAGAAGLAVVRQALDGGASGWREGDLVAGAGEWVAVAAEADLTEGAVVRFSTAAFDGFVVNDAGEVRALSASCTHLGCQLQYRSGWPDLRCPCHGASFNLRGWLANGRDRWRDEGPYRGDEQAYPIELPPLARPKVKVAGGRILVWTART